MLKPTTYWRDYSDIEVQPPVFFLGVQGGGLTLVSRVLRRHSDVVSVTGSSRYWSGADEMHTVLGPILPRELSGIRYKPPQPDHPRYPPPRSWTYAIDEMLSEYRLTGSDATSALRQALLRAIRMSLSRHADEPGDARFTDKSQVYTVRVSFLKELLKPEDPFFVLVTMNPYAVVYKSAAGRVPDMERLKAETTLEERISLCAEHWSNSYGAAVRDGGERMMVMRFEDFLEEPEMHTRQLCKFLRLEYQNDMIPQPGQSMPLGSKYRNRWHPLRPSRGQRWIEKMRRQLDGRGVEIIERKCGNLAGKFGYEAPSGK